jgi:hypothetical protein
MLFVPAAAAAVAVCCCLYRVLKYGIKASNKSCANMLPTLLETLPGRFQAVCVVLS